MILGAVIWHWWIAPLLVALGVIMIIATIIGYLKKVSSIKYPPKPKVPAEEDGSD